MGSVMNVVCHEHVWYELLCNERICYEWGLLWTCLLWMWSV